MLNHEYVEKVINFCTEKTDFAAFQAHTTPNFACEFMGTQPYALLGYQARGRNDCACADSEDEGIGMIVPSEVV